MKKIIVLGMSLLFAQAQASVGILCSNQVQLFDLAEGIEFHKDEHRVQADWSVKDYYQAAIAKLNQKSPYLGQLLKVNLDETISDVRSGPFILNDSAQLNAANFHWCGEEVAPVKVVSMYVEKSDELLIDKQYFSLMDNQHQAGVMIHEALERVYRNHFKLVNRKEARRLTSLLFTDMPVSNLEFNQLTDGILKNVFLVPIANFEAQVASAWALAPDFKQAEKNFSREVALPYGFTYKTQLTRQKLPPFQVMVMEREGLTEFVNHRFDGIKLDLSLALGLVIFGPPGAVLGTGMILLIPNLIMIASTGVPLFIPVVPIIAGVAAIGVAATGVAAVNQAKFTRAKNYLFEAWKCTKTSNACAGKEFKHLQKIYDRQADDSEEIKNLSIKKYAKKIVDLAHENKFYNEKAGKYVTRIQMKKIILENL